MEKVGKTTRPFRYDLNKIPYDYTVEMTNRFKELDLIDRGPKELWTEVHDIVQETWAPSLGWEDPLGKEKAMHSSILAWGIPWTNRFKGLDLIVRVPEEL